MTNITDNPRFEQKEISLKIIIDKVGFDQDHIHIFFCGAAPKMALVRVISIIKSITARKIFEQFPKLRKEELWGGEFWSDGKYIGTVGEATSDKVIRKYIRNHSHSKKETESRMEQLKLFSM